MRAMSNDSQKKRGVCPVACEADDVQENGWWKKLLFVTQKNRLDWSVARGSRLSRSGVHYPRARRAFQGDFGGGMSGGWGGVTPQLIHQAVTVDASALCPAGQLAVGGGWQRLVVGGRWQLAVGGPRARSLRVVLNKKHFQASQGPPCGGVCVSCNPPLEGNSVASPGPHFGGKRWPEGLGQMALPCAGGGWGGWGPWAA